MRQNVLATGLVACVLATVWPAPAFATQLAPRRATTQSTDRSDADRSTEEETWFWGVVSDTFTIPLGPTLLDPWPHGPCRAPCVDDGN